MQSPVQVLRRWRRQWQVHRRYNGTAVDLSTLAGVLGQRPRQFREELTEAELLHRAQIAAYEVADLIDRAAAVAPSPKTSTFYSLMAALIRGELDDDLVCLVKVSQGHPIDMTPKAEFLYGMIMALQRGDLSDDLVRFINGAKQNNPARRKAIESITIPAVDGANDMLLDLANDVLRQHKSLGKCPPGELRMMAMTRTIDSGHSPCEICGKALKAGRIPVYDLEGTEIAAIGPDCAKKIDKLLRRSNPQDMLTLYRRSRTS